MLESAREILEDVKVIVFRLQNEEYGVEVQQVKSIERLDHITRIPKTPKFVRGVINLRGVVTPIIDLRERFDLEPTENTEGSRIIVVAVNDLEVGLIVDSANDVIDIPLNAIEPPPKVVGGVEAVYLRGVAKLQDRLLILLNLNRVLNLEEIKQLELIEGK
jgi:purine-binding chemotaxis protein CheW